MAFKNDFRPDIIAGNPPYNNGMDIDFVFDAVSVARVAVSEITPAKFQTADANQKIDSKHTYGDFRKEIVPTIHKIIYYPDSAEIFAIEQPDGITIYTLRKNKTTSKCEVINRCNHQKYFNNIRIRNLCNANSLNNIGNDLCEYIDSTKFSFGNPFGKYKVYTGGQVAWGHAWGYCERHDPCSLISRDGNCYVIGVSKIIDMDNTEEVSIPTDAINTFASNNKEECESFISWLNTKFTRFFALINIGKRTITDDIGFRLVPEPPLDSEGRHYIDVNYTGWNHIYTDIELYKYYNLYSETAVTLDGDKFIDIIEAVIKGR